MAKYIVTGMSCASCVSHVEKAVLSVAGVDSVSVNLLTGSMIVNGKAKPDAICSAVRNAGYDAKPDGEFSSSGSPEEAETKKIAKRLILSVIFLIPLVWISMGEMLSLPYPDIFSDALIKGISEMVLSAVICIINRKFFINGTKGVLHLSPNMDTLVSLGAAAAFVYSFIALFTGDSFYFESAGMILTLITLGKLLESKSKGKTTSAIRGLIELAPPTATVLLADGAEKEIPASNLSVGDLFVIRSGSRVPADGTITDGNISVDESALTGESLPVDKDQGQEVSAATVCTSGYAVCRATRTGQDTTLSQIIRMVQDATSTKAPIEKTADKVAGVFVPVVLGIAAVTFLVWMLCGESVGNAIERAIAVLVISCPCSLGLATPVAIMVGSGKAARNGILFKTASALETAGKVGILAIDKTGTLTRGQPSVTDVIPASDIDEETFLQTVFSLEKKSEHPLAKAIVQYCEDRQISCLPCESFSVHTGSGVTGTVSGENIRGGNETFLHALPDNAKAKAEELSGNGKTPLFFSVNDTYAGLIALSDALKDDASQSVLELQNMGIQVVLLTGDNERTASVIGKEAGIQQIYSNLKPDGKAQIIRSLSKNRFVAMVGDGINDAPALATADIGIAIGSGTDIAIDAADIVLMQNHLRIIPAAIRTGRRVLTNIRENLFWALFYNAICIPLAAGVWIPVFGWHLHPAIGALAMSLSSFCVVMNALRLNIGSVYQSRHDRKKIYKKARNKTMTKTLFVNGMMCPHCEARVKKCLEALPGVSSAEVSHLAGTAVVTLSSAVADDELRKAVEEQGYEVTSVQQD